jgi:hypothetical protein
MRLPRAEAHFPIAAGPICRLWPIPPRPPRRHPRPQVLVAEQADVAGVHGHQAPVQAAAHDRRQPLPAAAAAPAAAAVAAVAGALARATPHGAAARRRGPGAGGVCRFWGRGAARTRQGPPFGSASSVAAQPSRTQNAPAPRTLIGFAGRGRQRDVGVVHAAPQRAWGGGGGGVRVARAQGAVGEDRTAAGCWCVRLL